MRTKISAKCNAACRFCSTLLSADASSSFRSMPAQKSPPAPAPHDAHGAVEIGALQQGEQGVDHGRVDRVLLSGRLSVAVSTPPSSAASTRSLTWELQLETQQRGRKHLPLGVGLERNRAAAVQRAMQQEVQGVQVGSS